MKYQIELTKDQVECLSMACEIVARLGMGQTDDALREVPESPCGISGAEDRHQTLWDIYQVLRHELAWQKAVDKGIIESIDSKRKWPEMIQVYYDTPVKQGDEPLCKITPIK